MTGYSLYDYPAVPGAERDSPTSVEAGASMVPHAPSLREKVFEAIKASPIGLTSDECEAKLKLRHQTVSARFRELALAQRIEDMGRRRTTRSGRKAAVYKVREQS